MKKLLATILCVVMVLSLAPAAFAAYDTTDQRVWQNSAQSEQVVEALRTNIQNMYGGIAADNAVVDSMKTTNTMINDLVDEMLKDYKPNAFGTNQSKTAIRNAIRAGIKSTVGGMIIDYLDGHTGDYNDFDSFGNRIFNPAKYATAFGTALSKALSSEDAVAGITAFMLYAAQRTAYEDVAKQAQQLSNTLPTWWQDYGFAEARNSAIGAPSAWTVMGILDGTLTNVNHTYEEYLSIAGLLGADLNLDALLDTDNETVDTPLAGTPAFIALNPVVIH